MLYFYELSEKHDVTSTGYLSSVTKWIKTKSRC